METTTLFSHTSYKTIIIILLSFFYDKAKKNHSCSDVRNLDMWGIKGFWEADLVEIGWKGRSLGQVNSVGKQQLDRLSARVLKREECTSSGWVIVVSDPNHQKIKRWSSVSPSLTSIALVITNSLGHRLIIGE